MKELIWAVGKYEHVLLLGDRQTRKTTDIAHLAALIASNSADQTVLIVSHNNALGTYALDIVRDASTSACVRDSRSTIRYDNGCKVIASSSQACSRGLSADYIIFDDLSTYANTKEVWQRYMVCLKKGGRSVVVGCLADGEKDMHNEFLNSLIEQNFFQEVIVNV